MPLEPLPNTPRVSVITMCKDRAWCIDECVRSVIKQDYPNLEHIVQDGESQDNTLDVLAKYGDRARIYSEPDLGPMDAFHKALARATGDLFCLLLSDERFHDRHVVSRVVDAFRAFPDAGAIYGDFRTVDSRYREIRIEKKRQVSFEDIFCSEDFISPCAAFVRMDALKSDGVLDEHLRSYFDRIGDFGLWVYVGARHPLKHVPIVMADFMVHDGEISYGLNHCQAYIRECERAIDAFHSDGYSRIDLAALKKRALARLYLNYSSQLAGRYFRIPMRLAWKGIALRPRLILTRTFVATLVKAAGLYSLLPARGDGRRVRRKEAGRNRSVGTA
ncbi:MAG: glycosyltransferase [Acidobacteriota bacterium]